MESRINFNPGWLVRALVLVLTLLYANLLRQKLRSGIAWFWIWMILSGTHGLRFLRHLI